MAARFSYSQLRDSFHHSARFTILLGGLVAINFGFSQKYWVAIIIPIDELIFFRGVAQTTNQKNMCVLFTQLALFDYQ